MLLAIIVNTFVKGSRFLSLAIRQGLRTTLPKYSELYAAYPTTWEALTVGAILYQGIGVETVVGMAEPQPAQYDGLASMTKYMSVKFC